MLDEQRKAAQWCSYCPKLCRFACPVAHVEARETVTPTAKQSLLLSISDGQVPWDQDRADTFFRCTGCDLHTTACEHSIRVAPAMFDARGRAQQAGFGHPALADLPRQLDEAEDEHRETVRDTCEGARAAATGVLWFPGCSATRPPASLATLGWKAARALSGGQVRPAPTPGCCGYPLLAGGFPQEFRERARRVAHSLEAAGRVLTADPICAWTLRVAYAEVGVSMPVPIEHLAEVAAESTLARGPGPRKVAFHDPCYLSRRLDVREAPRKILRELLGHDPLELPWAARGGWCSGGGGLLPETTPDSAGAIADELLAQAREVGAEEVVTACPRCHRSLSERPGGPIVTDLVEWLAQ